MTVFSIYRNNDTFITVLKRREECSELAEKEYEIKQNISPFYPLSSSHYDVAEDTAEKQRETV